MPQRVDGMACTITNLPDAAPNAGTISLNTMTGAGPVMAVDMCGEWLAVD